MANLATALTVIPAHVEQGQPSGLITPVVAVVDTAGTLTLFTPTTLNYAACVGMNISESGGFTGVITSGSTDLMALEIAADAQPIFKRIGSPLFVGNLGEALKITNASGAITKALFYFMQLGRLSPGF